MLLRGINTKIVESMYIELTRFQVMYIYSRFKDAMEDELRKLIDNGEIEEKPNLDRNIFYIPNNPYVIELIERCSETAKHELNFNENIRALSYIKSCNSLIDKVLQAR